MPISAALKAILQGTVQGIHWQSQMELLWVIQDGQLTSAPTAKGDGVQVPQCDRKHTRVPAVVVSCSFRRLGCGHFIPTLGAPAVRFWLADCSFPDPALGLAVYFVIYPVPGKNHLETSAQNLYGFIPGKSTDNSTATVPAAATRFR